MSEYKSSETECEMLLLVIYHVINKIYNVPTQLLKNRTMNRGYYTIYLKLKTLARLLTSVLKATICVVEKELKA